MRYRLPWNKHPHEVTYGGQTRAWTEARVSVSHTGSRMDSAPPASKRRVRSGPNLHSGETHHCVRRPLCPRPQLVHDSAKVCSHVLFPGRLRPDPGVGPCMEQTLNPLIPGRARTCESLSPEQIAALESGREGLPRRGRQALLVPAPGHGGHDFGSGQPVPARPVAHARRTRQASAPAHRDARLRRRGCLSASSRGPRRCASPWKKRRASN